MLATRLHKGTHKIQKKIEFSTHKTKERKNTLDAYKIRIMCALCYWKACERRSSHMEANFKFEIPSSYKLSKQQMICFGSQGNLGTNILQNITIIVL